MTAMRAASYCGGGLLLLAALSYGGSIGRQSGVVEEPSRPVETTGTESIAAEVQAQTHRLRARLAEAPSPKTPARNPFAFEARVPTARPLQQSATAEAPLPQVLPIPDPAIELVGVAEDLETSGYVRTAIISTLSGELFLVKEGETVAARYRVKAVSPTSVELADLTSGAIRRLTLRE